MLSEQDKKLILELSERLTGAAQSGKARQDSLVANVRRRMEELKLTSLIDYLQYVDSHPDEHSRMLSALTIHTTSWFRENPHFVIFQEYLFRAIEKKEVFKIWCSACSTGEEAYSFALILEEFRRFHPEFDYRVYGSDIDPISVAEAQRAIYSSKQMNAHVGRYKHLIMEGSGPTEGFFTLKKEIRERCRFWVHDLRNADVMGEGPYHVVACRNVLIYFDETTMDGIVNHLVKVLLPDGRLLLGHSEKIQAHSFGLIQEGHSVYLKPPVELQEKLQKRKQKYKILCIDDSALTRAFMERVLGRMGFEVQTARSSTEATNFLNFNDVDLILLDLNMPHVNGLTWLKSERDDGLKTPIVIVSEAHTSQVPDVVDLLASGAQEYIEKTRLASDPDKVQQILTDLIVSAQVAPSGASKRRYALPLSRPDVILMGASTGGPQAFSRILKNLPLDCPPIVIIQHISPRFAKPLAERLAEDSGLKLGKSEDMTLIQPGHIYMSFGDYHLAIDVNQKQEMVLRTPKSAPFNGHRPSVDYLFNSMLGIKKESMAILLTGMGRDGALGMRFLSHEGVFCVAQAEEDCAVYGMPREAIERGSVSFVGNLDQIHQLLLDSFKLTSRRRAA